MTESKSLSAEWGSLTSGEFQSNEKWWPNALNLRILHQHHPDSTPFGRDFDYREQLLASSTSTSSHVTSTP
jgi:catalase-peroxidase